MAYKKPKTDTQICGTCHEEKPATTDHFHKNKNGRNGLSSICRPCRNEYLRQLRLKNKNSKLEEN